MSYSGAKFHVFNCPDADLALTVTDDECEPYIPRGAAALVVGSEGKGISRLVKDTCDHLVSLPMSGRIGSLNASVACGILLYEGLRQRRNLMAR